MPAGELGIASQPAGLISQAAEHETVVDRQLLPYCDAGDNLEAQ